MKLWTWHGRSFSITEGHVDHTRSDYCQDVRGYTQAVARLGCMLGSDQFLWCLDYRVENPWPRRVEWSLEVPDDAILAFVDTLVWERILGNQYIPHDLESRWLHEAMAKGQDPDAFSRVMRQQFEDVLPHRRELWDNVFAEAVQNRFCPDCERNTVLIPFPAKPEWVLRAPTP